MKKINPILVLIVAVTLLASCQNEATNATADNVEIKTELDSVAYAIGVSIGGNIEKEGLKEINDAAIAKGARELLAGTAQMDVQAANNFLRDYFSAQQAKKFETHIEESNKFFAENGKKEGVKQTESGLQYKVLKEGTGPKPTATDKVKVHYHGTLLDGTVFDSSVERGEPISFGLDRVIKGWTEGLQLMPVGSKYVFYIPSELAYGQNPRPGGVIEPNMSLIFEVELLDIEKTQEKE